MAKIIIKFNNEVIDHIDLRQGDMKIGRKPGCEIMIDNLAISGEHANIFTVGEDSFIQTWAAPTERSSITRRSPSIT
jgi:pSer/pThr/pTyr-binding forkhead associated (FHA) protein